MNEALILDTETTTIENAEVIELAYRPFNSAWVAGDIKSARFKPKLPPAFGALATHHILMSELEGYPPSEGAPAEVPNVEYWIGHNIDFDWKALGKPPVKRICTLAICRYLWPLVDSHTLTAMMYYLKGATPETREKVLYAHNAAADVDLVTEVLREIITSEGIQDMKSLYKFSEEARIPLVFTFGKFKGQPISAADRGYAGWYSRQPEPDPYLLVAFRRARLLG